VAKYYRLQTQHQTVITDRILSQCVWLNSGGLHSSLSLVYLSTCSLKKSSEMLQYADFYLLLNYSTCFGCPSRPSSGVHKNVVAASGTDHTVWGARFLKRHQIRTVLIWSRLRKLDSVICSFDYYRDVTLSVFVVYGAPVRMMLGSEHNHHHKHQGLDPLIRSVSRVTAARANASSVYQLFSFLVVCSGMISKGFTFVAFFASVKASSVCIHLSCLICL